MGLFAPTFLRERVTDLTPAWLRARGVRGLLLDVDNTLTEHYDPDLSDGVRRWLRDVSAAGIALVIVSNAKRRRVEPFAEKVGLPGRWLAAKPLPFGLWRGVRQMGLSRRDCLVVGDQTFTDTLGANLAGIRCVQLTPLRLEENKPFLMFKRRLEGPILQRVRRRMSDTDKGE